VVQGIDFATCEIEAIVVTRHMDSCLIETGFAQAAAGIHPATPRAVSDLDDFTRGR
jgi:hypothetical protein